jgi:hypothetical protein
MIGLFAKLYTRGKIIVCGGFDSALFMPAPRNGDWFKYVGVCAMPGSDIFIINPDVGLSRIVTCEDKDEMIGKLIDLEIPNKGAAAEWMNAPAKDFYPDQINRLAAISDLLLTAKTP